MFEWNVEEMALMNEKSNVFIGKTKIYNCENKLSREEKIAFVDKMQDGKLSYILELAEKLKSDSASMPKDGYGNIKTVSLKAWINRNDNRKLVNNNYNYGVVYFFRGVNRSIENLNIKGVHSIFENYVDEVFHWQLKECEEQERKYFLDHDEYSILKKKFREKNYNTTFGVHIISSSSGEIFVGEDFDKCREITIDELKYLLAKYEELDRLVEQITKETNIKY